MFDPGTRVTAAKHASHHITMSSHHITSHHITSHHIDYATSTPFTFMRASSTATFALLHFTACPSIAQPMPHLQQLAIQLPLSVRHTNARFVVPTGLERSCGLLLSLNLLSHKQQQQLQHHGQLHMAWANRRSTHRNVIKCTQSLRLHSLQVHRICPGRFLRNTTTTTTTTGIHPISSRRAMRCTPNINRKQ